MYMYLQIHFTTDMTFPLYYIQLHCIMYICTTLKFMDLRPHRTASLVLKTENNNFANTNIRPLF